MKIHATLLNARYTEELRVEDEGQGPRGEEAEAEEGRLKKGDWRGGRRGGGRGGGPPPKAAEPPSLSMDVREVMAQLADFDFGTFTLDQLHICTTGSSPPDEYYATLAEIHF